MPTPTRNRLAQQMTAPETRTGGFDANARGIAVLVVAVLVALLLLLKAGGDGNTSTAADDTGGGVTTTAPLGGSTTTTPDDTTTTTAASSGDREPKDVTVLVLNGGGPAGVAKANSDAIGEKGYTMGAYTNASATVATTVVYYADGYQAEAEAVASALGKSADVVEAMPDTPPGPGADTADVVVVLGQDTPPA